ncbi:MAG TPA: Asp-tRNA(Asn)/Glu-tRNA(Gln) amidotransferase subunit GatA [Vicinamibacterales bacterium]|nr:Asp-tRNA(Asn)/Glu-tRNA(Gln) amidotransferase subunit GatA [Vicinamibacterales bacterium]
MAAPDLHTIDGVKAALAAGTRVTDVIRASLDAIEAGDGPLNAFTLVARDAALERAEALDAAPGDGPLRGVPFAVKDNICTRGIATTASSRILRGYVPPYDATVITRLIAAGAVLVGKTNCDEFAMGSSTENSAFGPTRNPWDTSRAPGGSSGGSAAAVAAGFVPFALGSDTGGSVRQPAALCGLVGLKPTYGRVSRCGLLAFGSSLDQIAPMTWTVRDTALVMNVIAGHDPADSTSAAEPVPDYAAALDGRLEGVRLGVPRHLLREGVDDDLLALFDAAIERMRAAGAQATEIELPHARYAIPVYYLVATAEASSNLARYDGVRYGHRSPRSDTLRHMYDRTRDEGFGPEVKRRIMLGTYVLSAGYYDAYYLKAQQVRTLIRRDYDRAFESVDVVVMPTTPAPAFRLGEKVDDPLQMYLEDVFTVSANLGGLPALSVPCGLTQGRLPVGLQLIGRMFDERTLLRVGDAYERVRGPMPRPARP